MGKARGASGGGPRRGRSARARLLVSVAGRAVAVAFVATCPPAVSLVEPPAPAHLRGAEFIGVPAGGAPARTPAPDLGLGSRGSAVVAVQRRLSALGYWLGASDGIFGPLTEQAVFAIQKAAGLAPDGIVGPKTRAALAAGVVPRPRSTVGYVIEIDLAADLLLFVANGRVAHVLNTSTGGGYWYREEGMTYHAVTPTGRFRIYRQVDGLDVSPLGRLWRPKYFTGGVALHGYDVVPPIPVSHGCVRVSISAMNWIWAQGLAPIGTQVWVY